MAPTKRKAEGEVEPANSPAESTWRVTRGSVAAARRQTRSSTQAPPNKTAQSAPKKPAPAAKKKSKSKKKEEAKSEDAESEEEAKAEEEAEVENMKTIVIERWMRAEQVKASLEVLSGVKVTINPVKPRRGCFEIREEGGETFISLLDMKRPFQPMRDLNMQEVIDNIIQKIKE